MTTMSKDALKFLSLLGWLLLSSSVGLSAQELPPTAAEKEEALLDFQAIRGVLESDMLDGEAEQKEVQVQTQKKERLDHNKALYQLPNERDFWGFFSEYWLVKNAPVLKWDFTKPDYGIAPAFENLLEQLGILNQPFKILLLDNPSIPHFALPSNPGGEMIFLLSVPFMRSLDLSKQEISLLLLENYFRMKQGYFKKMATSEELQKLFGANFQGQKLDKSALEKLAKKYDEIIFDKGFQFQQQFEITRQMDQILKNDLKLWNTYFSLIQRIDGLVKSNLLYQRYNQIYPSTELQLNWLRPKQSVL